MLGFSHFPELIVVLIIALVIFGPKRLPELGSSLGKGIREFRKATNELHDTIKVDDTESLPPQRPSYTASDYVAPTHTNAEYAATPEHSTTAHPGESQTPRV